MALAVPSTDGSIRGRGEGPIAVRKGSADLATHFRNGEGGPGLGCPWPASEEWRLKREVSSYLLPK